jgi:hypothetical protein
MFEAECETMHLAGTGDGLSQAKPFKISQFWSVADPGKILCLLDGTYRGSDSD